MKELVLKGSKPTMTQLRATLPLIALSTFENLLSFIITATQTIPMEFNQSRVLASDLFLISTWNDHHGTPAERRSQIFHDFIAFGMRGRWPWHAKAEKHEFSQFTSEEKSILESREWPVRCIAGWIGEDLRRVVVLPEGTGELDRSDVEFRTDLSGDEMLVCRYDGNPFDVLPELVYSMTAFDDPDDVEEARRGKKDQSLWASGVFWRGSKILWVDEYGVTIREKVCDLEDREGMREAAEALERFRPFESTWWTEATKIGKYAEENWWA